MSEIKPGDEYITLELSMDEAQAVADVLGCVNSTQKGRRIAAGAVYYALVYAGVDNRPDPLFYDSAVGAMCWKPEFDKID